MVIGEGVLVGAGSVVTKDVPSFSVVVGNPGKVVKLLLHEEENVYASTVSGS